MPATHTTTREFHMTIFGKRYANSKSIERNIHGNMILTGSNCPADILHSLQPLLANMKDFHSIGDIEIIITAPAVPRS